MNKMNEMNNNNNLEVLAIFPVAIHISKYDGDISEEFNFIKNITYVPNGNNGNFRSVNTFILKSKEMEKINEFILKQLNIYTKKILLSDNTVAPTISWTNKNPKASRHHEHSHPNSILSGVFYFSINESAPIQFHKNEHGGMQLDYSKYNDWNNGMYATNMNVGELVLFPSTVRHSVPLNASEATRYSLSFNTFINSTIGSTSKLTYLNLREIYNAST